mmetsp:Transcript_26386/g.75769  ORF Transcript_26386/g.75769 Transcript_26386/m.75769 type:complete len:212 (+) Transcript_26386:438-1073(+)
MPQDLQERGRRRRLRLRGAGRPDHVLRAPGRGHDAAGSEKPALPVHLRHCRRRAEDAERAVRAAEEGELGGHGRHLSRRLLPGACAVAEGAGRAAAHGAPGAQARRRGPPDAGHPHGHSAAEAEAGLRAQVVPGLEAGFGGGREDPAPVFRGGRVVLHLGRHDAGRRRRLVEQASSGPAGGLRGGGPHRLLLGGLQPLDHHAPAEAARREV